jgi:hypothetical protein
MKARFDASSGRTRLMTMTFSKPLGPTLRARKISAMPPVPMRSSSS